jgi:hypothetical protein
MAATLRNPPARTPHGKAPSRMNRLITCGLLHAGAWPFARFPYSREYAAGSQNLAAPGPSRTPFGPTVREKIFFITFKAGMLLKTHESRTKLTNFEGLFRRKRKGFARLETNCAGFAGFEANPEVYLNDKCTRLGAKCQAYLVGG